jgi:phage recombination protein Bet
MNELTIQPSRLPIAPAIAREYDLTPSVWRVLVEQTFPAAKSIEAVLMALAYCKQRNLDIFKRPVHIVPMWDAKKRAFVETVWEGIASIRTTASRTGAYAGIDAVEYGPTVRHEFRGQKDVWEGREKTGTEEIRRMVEYPEWASVVVYRMIGGQRCPYHAKVYWRETYATMGKMDVPNEMWAKRPFGQLDKCVEAAALRKAFPEELGNTYTVDEMEGRTIEGSAIDAVEEPKHQPPKPPAKPVESKPKEPPKPPPKPPAKPTAKKKEEEPPPEESFDPDTGEIRDEPSPSDLLTELDVSLHAAKTAEEVVMIYDEYDLEARLSEMPQGDEFVGVAVGIKRRHLKRVNG